MIRTIPAALDGSLRFDRVADRAHRGVLVVHERKE